MKVLYGYRNLRKKLRDPVAAIGIFDGIHIGHKKVIKKVMRSHVPGRDKVIITFDPHPQLALGQEKVPSRIMSLEHRLFIFEKMGLDAAIVIHFTGFIASMTPEEFIRQVLQGIGTRRIYVGDNFHFGAYRKGNVADFKKIGAYYGIEVIPVPPVRKKGKVVSSTWLRRLISAGEIKKAEELLRRPVSVLGTVVKGDRRGGTLGIPTANIDPHHEVIPPPGVYAVKIGVNSSDQTVVEHKGRQEALYDGVLNIGFKPTFYGRKLKRRKEPQIEAHVIGFKGDLYGRFLEIFFIKRLRREKKFRNTEGFRRQIAKDIAKAEKILGEEKVVRAIERYRCG